MNISPLACIKRMACTKFRRFPAPLLTFSDVHSVLFTRVSNPGT